MSYEAMVPVHRRLLWPAVTDAERLLRAVPNLIVDATDGPGVAGRIRLRIADRSVTFRGVARIVEVHPATLSVILDVEAAHGRADGGVEGQVEIMLLAAGSGTRVVVRPDLRLTGQSPAIGPEALHAAGERLVGRWFSGLAMSSPGGGSPAAATDSVEPTGRTAPSEPPSLSVLRLSAEEPTPPSDIEPLSFTVISGSRESDDATPERPVTPLRLVCADATDASATAKHPDSPELPITAEPERRPGESPRQEPVTEDPWSLRARRTRARRIPLVFTTAGLLSLLVAAATAAVAVAVIRAGRLRRGHRR